MVLLESTRKESLETTMKGGGSIAGFVPTKVTVTRRRRVRPTKKKKKKQRGK